MEIEHKNKTGSLRRKEILGIDLPMGCDLSTAKSLSCTCMITFTVYPSVL